MSKAETRVIFQCCFCAGAIAEDTQEPVSLVIHLEDGGSQELRCHPECLRRVVHRSVPLAI